jgi:hypothetical protein
MKKNRKRWMLVAAGLALSALGVSVLTASLREQARKQERVQFALNLDGVPRSLEIEALWVENWTDYSLMVSCRDHSGETDYLLKGRDWTVTEVRPYTLEVNYEGRRMHHTIMRKAIWETDRASAEVLFDQDGERFIVRFGSW